MKTAAIGAYGDLDVLEINDVPKPDPDRGEVLVAVVASTINPVDTRFRTPGTPQQVPYFPAVLGWDLAGIVITAPAGSGWAAGDRVVAMHPPRADGTGSWQQYVTIPATSLAPAPHTVDLPTAATLPLAALTADQALARLSIREGDEVLVTGAVGSVGGFALQMATGAGATVTGVVSRPEHESAALELGASAAHAHPAVIGAFDAVLDTVGLFDHPGLLRDGGRFVTISDDLIPEAIQRRASLAVHNYVGHDPARLRQLSEMVDAGRLRLRVSRLFPLSLIKAAHRHAEGHGHLGKTVITM